MNRSVALLLFLALSTASAFAGGPMLVGGPAVGSRPAFGVDGQPFTWDVASMPLHYRVDPGPMASSAGSTIVSNAEGLQRVQAMFGVWSSVPTATVSATNTGALLPAGSYAGGDVTTVSQYNDLVGSCRTGAQNPIIFDANGSIVAGLGLPPEIIGFTQICKLDTNNGHITAAMVTMNGKFQDKINSPSGSAPNYELTANEFDETITHEIGHFLGLDHSQINVDMFSGYHFPCDLEGLAALPLMFPIAMCQAKKDSGLPVLAPDDVSWISTLYPSAARANAYGTISGAIFFGDGQSHFQGANIVVRLVDDPSTPQDESRQFAYSVVSGYRFTANPGQSVSGDNSEGDATGSRQPGLIGYYEVAVPPGTYTVQVESIDSSFEAGSSVGPLSPPIGLPGAAFGTASNEYWNQGESAFDFPLQRDTITVSPGISVTGIDIILNSSPATFDQYEDLGDLIPPIPGRSAREGASRA